MGDLADAELERQFGIRPRRANAWGKHPEYTPPTKKKETPMTERMTKAQIDHELRVNAQLMETLRGRRADLIEQARTAIPAEPPNHTMFTVGVRFKMRGARYQFLILRSGRKYFTTGTKEGQMKFDSWADLIGWLEGPEVYDHTDIEILRSAGIGVSFDTGAIERLDKSEPPF